MTTTGVRFEHEIREALAASPEVATVTELTHHKSQADFAIWLDESHSILGNPILVEVKAKLRGQSDIFKLSSMLAKHISETPARTGLIIYQESAHAPAEAVPANGALIFFISAAELSDYLARGRLSRTLVERRNATVHRGER